MSPPELGATAHRRGRRRTAGSRRWTASSPFSEPLSSSPGCSPALAGASACRRSRSSSSRVSSSAPTRPASSCSRIPTRSTCWRCAPAADPQRAGGSGGDHPVDRDRLLVPDRAVRARALGGAAGAPRASGRASSGCSSRCATRSPRSSSSGSARRSRRATWVRSPRRLAVVVTLAFNVIAGVVAARIYGYGRSPPHRADARQPRRVRADPRVPGGGGRARQPASTSSSAARWARSRSTSSTRRPHNRRARLPHLDQGARTPGGYGPPPAGQAPVSPPDAWLPPAPPSGALGGWCQSSPVPSRRSTALMQSRNLAARAGRWSAQHRKTAILGWILFVVLATVLGGMIGQNEIDESASGSGESKRGDMIVEAAGFPDQAGEQVLVQGNGSVKADDPQVTAAVRDVVSRLSAIPGITEIESPLERVRPRQHRLRRRPLGRGELHDARQRRARRDARRAAARRRGRRPEGPLRRARRAVRRRVGREGDRRAGRQGRDALGGDLLRPDADHPARRVRCDRRRRPPARARRHRRHRHGRPARPGQPGLRARCRTSPSSW